jgi:hypothetical protein
MRRCENCNKIVWCWNKFWRKHGSGIVMEAGHPKHMLTITFCSQKCYETYSRNRDWLVKPSQSNTKKNKGVEE